MSEKQEYEWGGTADTPEFWSALRDAGLINDKDHLASDSFHARQFLIDDGYVQSPDDADVYTKEPGFVAHCEVPALDLRTGGERFVVSITYGHGDKVFISPLWGGGGLAAVAFEIANAERQAIEKHAIEMFYRDESCPFRREGQGRKRRKKGLHQAV